MPPPTAPVPGSTSPPLTTRRSLYRQFGITAAALAAAAWDSILEAENGTRPGGHPVTFAPAAGGTADCTA
jgi:hypothetical protein